MFYTKKPNFVKKYSLIGVCTRHWSAIFPHLHESWNRVRVIATGNTANQNRPTVICLGGVTKSNSCWKRSLGGESLK